MKLRKGTGLWEAVGGIYCQSDSFDEGWVKSIFVSKSRVQCELTLSGGDMGGTFHSPRNLHSCIHPCMCCRFSHLVTLGAHAPGWSSALSLLMAMSQQPWQALALHLRLTLAASRHGVEVDRALGSEWSWRRHPSCPRWVLICRTPAPTQRNAVRLSRGPSPDSCACVVLFSPAQQKVQRQLSG